MVEGGWRKEISDRIQWLNICRGVNILVFYSCVISCCKRRLPHKLLAHSSSSQQSSHGVLSSLTRVFVRESQSLSKVYCFSHLEHGVQFQAHVVVGKIWFLAVVGLRCQLSGCQMGLLVALRGHLPLLACGPLHIQSQKQRISLMSNPSHTSTLFLQEKPRIISLS